MEVIKDIKRMQERSHRERAEGKIIVLVPTMGYLHEGHLALMREGRKRGDLLVISIFVNPAQFGPGEDYDHYPQDMQRDTALAQEVGVDIIFNPEAHLMYPPLYQTYVEVEGVTRNLCGASRPGHFRGVTTVVAKLFNIVQPQIAIFGEKDYQQLVTLRQMVRDLDIPVEIVGLATVRENDGLAVSSRNFYLTPPQRESARALFRALRIAEALFEEGERATGEIIAAATEEISRHPFTEIDYVKIVDPDTMEDLDRIDKPALLALAVKVGETRLIDNCILRDKWKVESGKWKVESGKCKWKVESRRSWKI